MDVGTSHAEQLNANVTPLAGAPRPPRLPVTLTSFVGRGPELAELHAALEDTRLLTLTGPGGCGKTRLALQLASELRFAGGIWWVDLAALVDERLVGAAVADALGLRPLELQAASTYLAPRRALVVLDNCEHLRDGCAAVVGALLRAAPEAVVVATSRAPLGVEGETDWRVPPLAHAVALFVERARKARPGFALRDGDATTIARICAELDGLPLAIELAAARVRMLSVAQIADGLAGLLTGGPRTASERQRTLRASLDWSYDLLSGAERVLLRRLSVFAGGFTLPDVEQVCGIEPERLVDLLGALVDQSLVIAAEHGAAMRYRLLETMRQFALERLAEAGEEEALRARHRDLFLALAEAAGPPLESGEQGSWLERLDAEAVNLSAAIEHAQRTDPALALRFGTALYRWWCARGRFAEAELAYSRALGAGPPGLRARALHGRAYLSVWAGDLAAAEAHATEALALAEEAGDPSVAARARCQLGAALHFADPQAGRAELARAAELARRAGDDWALGTAAWLTANTYLWQSDHARAARANEALVTMTDPLQVARHRLNVAWMACLDGRFAEARAAIERLRDVAAGEPVMEALADHFQSLADIWQGEPERALERQRAALERTLMLGNGSVMPWHVMDIASAELATGSPESARDRIHALLPRLEGRFAFGVAWALCLLAESLRQLGDDAAEATARQAQAAAERIDNRLLATRARLIRGRLAAARGDWPSAQQHALAHLDACVEGGHATFVPACLDALAEVAAGLHSPADAARLLGAAARARSEIGSVRVPPEAEHWAAIERRVRAAAGDRADVAALSAEAAVEWARRARGPRGRPRSGWASLTNTEARVVELAVEGLTNRQIGDRMFISPETVKTHLAHIFKKLDVRSRTELAVRAARR